MQANQLFLFIEDLIQGRISVFRAILIYNRDQLNMWEGAGAPQLQH